MGDGARDFRPVPRQTAGAVRGHLSAAEYQMLFIDVREVNLTGYTA